SSGWPPGEPLSPRVQFVLGFDRTLDPESLAAGVRLEYVGPTPDFMTEPFRQSYYVLAEEGRRLVLDPPDLLPGTTVRLSVTDSLRDAYGLPIDAASRPAPLTYHVLELPPPR